MEFGRLGFDQELLFGEGAAPAHIDLGAIVDRFGGEDIGLGGLEFFGVGIVGEEGDFSEGGGGRGVFGGGGGDDVRVDSDGLGLVVCAVKVEFCGEGGGASGRVFTFFRALVFDFS